jgi:O-antigen biosynthesis protein
MISVFSPTNNTKYLPEVYESLKAQSNSDWEWVILLNGDARLIDVPVICNRDLRVKPYRYTGEAQGSIGALKRACCELATGDIYVELDHDDLLMPQALQRIQETFDANPQAGMVYSNVAYVNEQWEPQRFGTGYGWEYGETEAFGHTVLEMVAPAPLPQHIARIWYAPDHVRAFRAKDYWQAGGHDPEIAIGDDHDLICRMYLSSEIVHINELLYVYITRDSRNSVVHNAAIQEQQWRNYETYVERLAMRWKDTLPGLGFLQPLALDLCSHDTQREGYQTVDVNKEYQPDFVMDLNEPWLLPENSCAILRAQDALEHLRDPVHVMNEAWRALVHGGFFFIEVPSTDGRGAFQDPTHVSYWNSNSFWYYTKASHQQYVPGIEARFQVLQLINYFPNEFCKQHNILYTRAHLIAIKDPSQPFHGEQGFA